MQPNRDYSQQLNSLMEQYQEIGKLTSGQKLAIDKSSGRLVRSFGSAQGGILGKTFQSFTRTVGSYTGYYTTEFKDVMSKMSEINRDFHTCLTHYQENPSELKLQQISHIKSVLNHAVDSLGVIKNTSYSPNSTEVQKNLEDQIDSIRKLVKDLETFTPPSEETSEEEDWMLVQKPASKASESTLEDEDFEFVQKPASKAGESTLEDEDFEFVQKPASKASESLGEEEFEFVQEKGEKFEQKISSFIDLIEDPKSLEDNPELTLVSSAESIFNVSSFDQEWEIIQKPLERGEAFISKMNHPYIDQKQAAELLKEFIKDAPNVQLSSKMDDHWQRITAALDKLSPKIEGMSPEQQAVLRALITDLVMGVLFPICDTGGNQRHLMPLNHLLDILRLASEDPVKFLNERKWVVDALTKKPPFNQKLHLLFLFNFTNPDLIKKMVDNPTYQAISSSPHLDKLILNSNVHVPQIYRQTCRGTVHNLLYQQHCGTIAEMLCLSNMVAGEISAKLTNANRVDLDAPAFKTIYGMAITKEQFVKQVLQATKEKIQSLEQKAVALAGSKNCAADQIEALTREWNFIMQDLETIQDPSHPRIYDKQYIPNMYYVSAAWNVLTTWVTQFIPGQPLVAERWASLDNELLYEIGRDSFSLPQRTYLYRNAYTETNPANSPTNLTSLQIWEEIDRKGGAVLEFFYLGGRLGSSGHAMFVKASLHEENPVIELWDPMSSSKRRFSIDDFRKFLIDNYDARKGKIAIMNHLALY